MAGGHQTKKQKTTAAAPTDAAADAANATAAASSGRSAKVTSATPYAWPYDGPLHTDDVALVLIDMQTDFCGLGGYVAQMGYDVSLTRAPIEPLRRVLASARAAGVRVIHTREGHRRSLACLPANKRWRSRQAGAGIGDEGPCGKILIRGEPGWNLIPELAPAPEEDVIDKPGKGTFCNTDLDLLLRSSGVKRLILGGITTDVCVHTTMREANDLGYECLLLEDGTAATDRGNHEAAIKMVHMQGGVFGATAMVDDVVKAFDALPRPALDIAESAEAREALRKATMEAGKSHAEGSVAAAMPSPYAWPAAACALVMIDWQKDFCHPQGFGASLGNDVSLLHAAVPAAAKVLAAARAASMPVIHTLEAHLSDLSDCPSSKLRRCPAIGEVVDGGDPGKNGRVLVRGEPGNSLIDELTDLPGEKIVLKPGKGAFYRTDLDAHLKSLGVTHLIFTGVTTEVCVQTSMREANDRGYECLLVEDATESYFPEFKKSTLEMITAQGAIVGWTAKADDVVAAMKK